MHGVGTCALHLFSPAAWSTLPAASDLWALGCIIFECATGRPPFAASTTQQLHALVLEAQAQLPPGGRISGLLVVPFWHARWLAAAQCQPSAPWAAHDLPHFLPVHHLLCALPLPARLPARLLCLPAHTPCRVQP
jgi:serine/threonine protein kinase